MKVALIVFALLLAGCATTAPLECPAIPTPKAQVIDKTCDVITVVHYRKALGDNFSDPTAKEVLKNNDHYTELNCGAAK
jgi:hypothetical protein